MTEEMQQESQVSENKGADVVEEQKSHDLNTSGEVDLSSFFKDGEAGKFDPEKITRVVKDLENEKKSKSYYQSLYMKKNEVPEKTEDYLKNFKPDSKYAEYIETEEGKENVNKILGDFHKMGVSERDAVNVLDYFLKVSADAGDFLSEAEAEKKEAERIASIEKEVAPFCKQFGRSVEQNNEALNNFLSSKNIFTNDKEIAAEIAKMALSGEKGYKAATFIMESHAHRGVPNVSGYATGGVLDRETYLRKLASAKSSAEKEAIQRDFYGEQ